MLQPLRAGCYKCAPDRQKTKIDFRTPIPKAACWRGLAFGHYDGRLVYGAAKSAQRVSALQRLRALINLLPALPLLETATEAYSTTCAHLETKGKMIGNNDLWIAAHTLASHLTLVTNKQKEFRRVHGVRVQNWAV